MWRSVAFVSSELDHLPGRLIQAGRGKKVGSEDPLRGHFRRSAEALSGDSEWVARAARSLRIAPEQWLRVLDRYEGGPARPSDPPEVRLGALHAAFAAERPDAAPLSGAGDAQRCPACEAGPAVPVFARSAGAGEAPLFVYGRCGGCGHGLLLSAPEPESLYADSAYFERRSESGAGYDRYEAELDYRVAKGRRLLGRIAALNGRAPGSLLEVGSGFGFTRAAARSLGWTTAGIDPNPAAAEAARRLFGLDTHVGTLASALEAGAVRGAAFDLLLYDFVLEHLAEPEAELRLAAGLLSPKGVLALTLPSMAAAEVDVFGGCYRSFRSDHRHLFSRESLTLMLERSGLRLEAAETGCTVHLLKGVLSEAELLHLYESGRGPDLTVIARPSRS